MLYRNGPSDCISSHEPIGYSATTHLLAQQAKQIEELRRKAAGVSGKSKDARADLMLQLLTENEALQEKLFEQNLHQKEERDRNLKRELQQISYQRVLLSNLLSERNVQEAVVEILGDDRRVEKLRSATPKLEHTDLESEEVVEPEEKTSP